MSEEVRGIWATVEWSESDVIDSLDAAGIDPTVENIEYVIDKCKHISDIMTERGWLVIDDAVSDLILELKEKENGK